MKKSIVILATILFCSTLKIFSQENVIFFQVEKESFLRFENFSPGTLLECYSTPHGGKYLSEIAVNASGEATQKYDVENTPAFVLNRKSASNIQGTNKVQHLDTKEFVCKNINMKVIAQVVQISWDAQVPMGGSIEFQIVKKNEVGDTKIEKIIAGITGDNFSHYTFSEPYTPNSSYTIQIVKEGKRIRYKTNPLVSPLSVDNIKVYPTICNDKLFVDIDNMNSNWDYTVIDLMGKKIQKGIFSDEYNVIDIHNIVAGNYIIIMGHEMEKYSAKFTKN